jgi:hypothetical protein
MWKLSVEQPGQKQKSGTGQVALLVARRKLIMSLHQGITMGVHDSTRIQVSFASQSSQTLLMES